ncbi:hypothetical protein BaRGS_00025447 [Batillaria attramentaria]|uniref:BTB domain-containing protein n=1 Tax=Batillaria attramentaria TaxID=370345 RepID=A0ABD0K888_9CAEN
MPVLFEPECGPKCRSKQHCLEVNGVVTKGTLLDLQAYSRLCHTWAQHTDTAGRSALHVAASCGKTVTAEWLLAEKHQDASLKDKESGWTALHRALFYGQLATARLLIQYHSELYCRDHEGLGPLDLVMKDRPKNVTFSTQEPNEVYSWGDNSNFTLGHANEQRRTMPEAVDTFRRVNISVTQIVMCKYHTVFLTQTGQVYTCGHGQGGRLGHGDELTFVTPRLVEALQNEVCTGVAAARDHTLFLTEKHSVYGCGLNNCSQMGMLSSGDKNMDKTLIPLRLNLKILKGKPVLGVCAGRFHTVVYTGDGIYTCGLNAGQIGHPKGERCQNQLRLVSYLHNKDAIITSVASSDAAIACLTTRGDIFLLHEYTCRKIASRWLDITKLCVSGGNLDHNTDLDVLREKGGCEVKVVLLNSSHRVFMWRSNSPSLKRCHWAIRRQVLVSDVALNLAGLLLVSDQGEAFTSYPVGRKSVSVQKDTAKDTNKESEAEFGKMSLMDLIMKDEVEEMALRRLPCVHRATRVACDQKGHNCAVLQALPNGCLTDVPSVSESTLHSDFQQLMEEADVFDAIHDTVVQVDHHQWPAHLYILASRADYFRKQVPLMATESNICGEKPVIEVTDVQPEVMEQLLKFIYTDTCDLLNVGAKFAFSHTDKPAGGKEAGTNGLDKSAQITFEGKSVSAFEVAQKKKKGKGAKEEKEGKLPRGRDPVKILQEAARKFGVKGLSKRLEAVKCVNGVIQSQGKKLVPPRLRLERTKLPEVYDVCIRAEDSTTIQCHKCVLTARLEYFHSMLGSGWIETSDTKSLTLPIPGDILEILLDFVYMDDSPLVAESQDTELLCNVLVVADQLLVTRLKEMCEVALTSLMTLRNVGELLEIATAYNAGQLCRACQQFISLNLPALLESRNLDCLSEDTMQELTDYYRGSISAMSRRFITPWSDGPDHDFLAALTAEFDSEHVHSVREPPVKKPKSKRRQGRTKSTSEDPPSSGPVKSPAAPRGAERQISVSSDVSIRSEDDTDLDESCHTTTTQAVPAASTELYQPAGVLKGKSSASSAPIPIQGKGKSPVDVQQSGRAVPRWGSASSPPQPIAGVRSGDVVPGIQAEHGPSSGSVLSDSHKTGGKKGSARFSWKEVKKQQNKAALERKTASISSTTTALSPPAVSAPPACPWGSVSTVVQSFRDLMLRDKTEQPPTSPHPSLSTAAMSKSPLSSGQHSHAAAKSGKTPPVTTPASKTPSSGAARVLQPGCSVSWGLPARSVHQAQPTSPTPTSPVPASSPPDNPWQRFAPASPPEGATASVSFSDIVQDQIHQRETLEKATQKPLHLIQMEEQAMSEILKHYRAHDRFEEHITIERASRPIAAPLWRRQRSSTGGHS